MFTFIWNICFAGFLMILPQQYYGMNTKGLLLTLVGITVSLIVALVLIWYSKKTLTKTMSKRHILHMLKAESMNASELADAAKEFNSPVISHKVVPVTLAKLQEEGLIQRASDGRYVITTKGMESLNNLDSMGRELQKVAKIVQRTSTVSKFMVNDVIDRVAMISDMHGIYGKKLDAEAKASHSH